MRGGGTLVTEQEGSRVRFLARRPMDGKGLYKVWLHGDRGGKLLLGTLVPEGEEMELRRTLSVGELERAGCWPQFRAEAPLTFPFSERDRGRWYCEQHPERLLRDPVLKKQVRGPMLCQKGADGFYLAAPFCTDRPVSLEGLFCLSRVEKWSGGPHMVWSFERDGAPKCPNKKETPGHTG